MDITVISFLEFDADAGDANIIIVEGHITPDEAQQVALDSHNEWYETEYADLAPGTDDEEEEGGDDTFEPHTLEEFLASHEVTFYHSATIPRPAAR